MEGMQTGLRLRLGRALERMEDQHRLLREIGDHLDRAVATGSERDVETWLSRFTEALRSHFDLEESVVFPALNGMLESARDELAKLEEQHASFLENLQLLLRTGRPDDGASTLIDALAALREGLVAHERSEEGLIARALSLPR